MNELQIFNNAEFGEIRTVEIDGEPYFVGKDVAEALGYEEPRAAVSKKVDTEDRGVAKMETPSGTQEMTVINESGLYALVLSSKLPSAKKFKRWVTSEVLPTIRKHGAYMTDQTLEKALTSPDFLIQLATQLKEEKEKAQALKAENERMKPKEIFADAVTSSDTSILVWDLAKLMRQNGVKIGGKRLWDWMRDNGYICKASTKPTQKAMEQGLFEIIERTIQRADKAPVLKPTTKVTGKGQIYFINKFLGGANA